MRDKVQALIELRDYHRDERNVQVYDVQLQPSLLKAYQAPFKYPASYVTKTATARDDLLAMALERRNGMCRSEELILAAAAPRPRPQHPADTHPLYAHARNAGAPASASRASTAAGPDGGASPRLDTSLALREGFLDPPSATASPTKGVWRPSNKFARRKNEVLGYLCSPDEAALALQAELEAAVEQLNDLSDAHAGTVQFAESRDPHPGLEAWSSRRSMAPTREQRQSIIAKDIVRSQTPNPNIPTAEHIASLGILPYVKLTLRRSLEDPADVLSRSTVAPGTARLAEPTQSGRLREFHRGLEEEKRELIRLSREELNTLTRAIQAREKRLGKLVGDLDAMIKDSEVSVPDFLQYKKLQHSEAEVQRSTLEAQNYVQTLLTVFERTREAHTVMRKKVEEMREMIDAEERVLRSRYDSLSTAEASAMSFMREYILALHNHMMQQESIRVGMEAQEAEANLVRTALVDVQGDGARRERILVEMARDAEEYKARQQARVLAKLKRTRLKGVMHALQLDRDLGSRGRLTEEKSFSSRDLQHLLDNLPTSRRNLITLDDLQALEKMPLADVQAAILSGESRASIHLEPGASHPHLGSGASFRGGSSAASGSHHKSPSEIFRGFQEVLKTTGAKEPGDIVQVFEKVQFIRREQEQRKARFEEVQTQVRVMTAELARLKTAQDQRVFVQADEFDQPIAIAERRATATNARVQAADKSIATIQLFYDDLIHKLVHMPVPAAKGTRLYTALARLQGAFPGSDRPRERPDPWGDLSPPAGALASGGEGLRPGHSRRGSAVALESIMDEDLAGSAGATTGADGSVGHVRLLGYLTDLEVLLDAIVERNRALESEAGPQGGASLSRSISKMGTRSRMSSLAAAEGAESASPLWHGASFRDGGPPSAPVPEIFSALAAQPIPRSWLRRISHDVDEGGRIAIDGAGGSIKRSRSTSVQRGASEYQRHAPGYDGASGDGSDSDAEERLALGGAATDASAREDLRSSTERKRSVLGTPLSRSVRHPGDAEEVLDRSAVKEFKRRNSLVEAARTPRMSLGADHSGSASVGLQMAADGDAEIEKEATLPTFDGASAEDEEE